MTTSDAGAAAEALGGLVRRAQVQAPEAGGFELTMNWTMAGPLSIFQARVSASSYLRIGIDPPENLGLAQVTRGRLVVESGRHRFQVTTLPRLLPEGRFVSTMEGADLTMLTLEAAWTQDFAAELLQREDFRLRFREITPRNEDAARYWTDTVNHLRQDVLGSDEAMRFPLIRDEALRRAATALLWSFPGTFHDYDPPGEGDTVLPGPVHRAVVFIDEHLAQPLGLAEIAAAARLSPSQLVIAFRQHLGTTPGAYLRVTRLDAAHQDLLAADPTQGVTVAAIAHRWGFTDLPRFTTEYRHHYGCSPTSTLTS
ncbi:helix-turn-helix transcriptional regulator [Kocuria nitroreducens]|uniref:helix-turn-helix transcriptional regulator n=1 Tax=Kocuria nitroreducens TaxID=3058914 RepID=UPI0036D822F8